MQRPIWPHLFSALSLVLLMIGINPSAFANPNDYPEYTQHRVSKEITVVFVKANVVKQRLDDGIAQTIVDVRKSHRFQKEHLPHAVSIPLKQLPNRYVEIPRDIPVVLY